MKKLFTLFLFLSLFFVSFGAYLENIPTKLVQPNGEVLYLFITGDEFYNRVHDSEGYSVVQGKDGWYYYAMYDAEKDKLVPSEYVVEMQRTISLPMAKGLSISHKKYMEIRRAYFEPTGCEPSGASNKSVLKDLTNNGIKTTQQMNNIVICIGFADTEKMTNSFSYVNGMFNSNENNSMRDFFLTMSYNKLDLVSHFYPQPDENVLRFYKDVHPRSYYQPYSPGNPNGYDPDDYWDRTEREQTLLKNAIEWVNANYPIPADLDLDINNDGYCDFISFVVQGKVGDWANLLWPHKWSLFAYDVYINGKLVSEYNFELDGTSSYFSSNVFCHEGYHVLGAPDLYHYYEYTDIKAVGSWDLMDYSYLTKPQSMSAYMKYKYGNWITSLPVATLNKTYEIFPFYFNDGSDPEKPVIYRIPMTGTTSQYSLVEYRKKSGTNYDYYIPNQGFLIYRINSNFSGNAGFDGISTLDEVYLYRNGSSQASGVYTQGFLNNAPYNSTNGKTAFNSSTNPKPCQSNGTAENKQNINHILYDSETDSYTFFYGDPENINTSVNTTEIILNTDSGATGIMNITSNALWRISIPENAKEWVSVSKTKGIRDEIVTFTALSSIAKGNTRVANVTFTTHVGIYNIVVIQGNPEDIIHVNLIPNPVEGGTVTGGGAYIIGDAIHISAKPNKGYDFINWTENGTVVSSVPDFVFSFTKDIEFTANFAIKDGIHNNEQMDRFTVFPNPANNELRISNYELREGVIEIFDVYGKKLISNHFIISSTSHIINISELSTGVYFIRLTDGRSFATQRFVKE